MATPQADLARLMDGYLTTQLLYVAAKLGIADVLADGPRPTAAVADATGATPGVLHRILRGLAADGVLEEHPGGRFALTDLGAGLRTGVPGSMRGAIIARGDLYYDAAAGLLDAALGGGVPFERTHGVTFFEYMTRRPERMAAFQRSMNDRSRREAVAVVDAYDFSRFDRIVDVGGGRGILLAAILAAAPRLRGVLFDLPDVVAQATELPDRCERVAGDFFVAVPPGGDAYVLSRVIHDWDDDDARRILANVRAAMGDGGALILVEAILPDRAQDAPATIRMDLHMLTLLGARERTAPELRELLTAAGFGDIRLTPTRSPDGLSVIEAAPRG